MRAPVWLLSAMVCGHLAACDCDYPSVTRARKWADVVFQGRITEIADGVVTFGVARVWKGNIAQVFRMPDLREQAACEGFWPAHLEVGNDLLVYAQKQPPKDPKGQYFTTYALAPI
jgi:hypothetical protein